MRQRINELEKAHLEQRKYETELSQTKAMFEGLFEFAPDAILVVEPGGLIVRANREVERMFGHARNELLGAELDNLVPGRFRKAHSEHRKIYATEPRVRPMSTGMKLYGKKKSGTEFPVDVALGPLTGLGPS